MDIKSKGDRVKIPAMGSVNVLDYTRNNFSTGLTLQTFDDVSTMLEITEEKYYNFAIDNADQAQISQKLMTEAMRQSALAINDTADQFIFNKYGDAGNTVTATITSANITSTILAGLQKLWENNVPTREKIFLEVSPQVASKLILAKVIHDYDSSTLTNGKIGTFLGADICLSNNVVQSSTLSYCLLRTKKAISYAEQYVETTAYELGAKGFGDAVKGLVLYGAKVIQPKELVCLELTTSAETTI